MIEFGIESENADEQENGGDIGIHEHGKDALA